MAEVDAVARKARRIASPWWMSVAWALNLGVFWSIGYAGRDMWRDLLIAFCVFVVGTAILYGLSRLRGARSVDYGEGTLASGVSFWSTMASLATVQFVSIVLEPGAWTSYVLLVVLSMVVYLLGELAARMISRRSAR